MHGRHDANDHHGHAHGHERPHTHGHSHGHNHPPGNPVQWQTPHAPDEPHHDHETPSDEFRDLDLVEMAFIEGFRAASDPTSFVRLAGVAFEGRAADGRRLTLLRVEQQRAVDVGSVTPHFGGGSFRYAPLPARLVSCRETLAFVYFDGKAVANLTLAEARALGPCDGPEGGAGGAD